MSAKRVNYRFAPLIFFWIGFAFSPYLSVAQENNLGLRDLMHRALEKNADIQVQSGERRISGLKRWQALSRMFPKADAEVSYMGTSGRNGIPDLVAANGLKEKIAWLSVQQTIFDAETLLNLSENQINQEAQKILYIQTKQNILLRVVETYFAALKAKGEVDVFKENLDAFKILYGQSQLLYEAGVVPELDVKKTRIEYMLQQNSVAKTQKDYQTALNHIKELTGLAIEDSLSIQGFPYQTIHLNTLADYLNTATENRPELQILQLESRRFRSEKQAAFMQQFPSANAGIYYGWDTIGPFRSNNRGWQVFINLRLPLWDWGRLQLDRRIASIQYGQNETLRRKMQQQIAQEVMDAFTECEIQQQRMQVMQESQVEAAEAVRMARLGYQEGTITSLDVIDTQKLLTETRLQYLQALYDFYSDKARLYRNVGKLEEDFTWLK